MIACQKNKSRKITAMANFGGPSMTALFHGVYGGLSGRGDVRAMETAMFGIAKAIEEETGLHDLVAEVK